MSNNLYLSITFTFFILSGCGPESGDGSDGVGTTKKGNGSTNPIVTGSAEMSVADSWMESENGSYTLGSATKCTKNSSAGTLDAKFTSENHSLSIRLRNFSTTPKAYLCRQAQNNQTSPSSVGDQFNGCGITVTVDPEDGFATNQYGMFRESTTIPPFQYSGECKVDVSSAINEFRASITCHKMIQIHYDGSPRNPIDLEATADIMATLNCALVSE